MIDISQTVAPKSDQLNADDLIGGPRTIRVTKVTKKDGDQPIAVHFEGDDGKPYKPGKSMRRVLLKIWGSDGSTYAGRRMTLYRDDAVQFGGVAVGGIRISHMSGLTGAVTMALTVTKAVRRPYTVKPLAEERDAPKPTLSGIAREKARAGRAVFGAWHGQLKQHHVAALADIQGELDRLMDEADTREDGEPADHDDFPGAGALTDSAAREREGAAS